MYKIEGDGSWQNTKIWKDDVLIDWKQCIIKVDSDTCLAAVDGKDSQQLSRVLLLGVYKLIGDGDYQNTKLFINDEMLRGVQSILVWIEKGKSTMLATSSVFLPNLMEGEESD